MFRIQKLGTVGGKYIWMILIHARNSKSTVLISYITKFFIIVFGLFCHKNSVCIKITINFQKFKIFLFSIYKILQFNMTKNTYVHKVWIISEIYKSMKNELIDVEEKHSLYLHILNNNSDLQDFQKR